jgi:hypothetical protein
MKKVCENCKYELWSLWLPPCTECNIDTNNKWEPIDDVDEEDIR